MAHNPEPIPLAVSRRNRNVNRLLGRRKHLTRPWFIEQRRDFAPIRFCGQRNASRVRLRAKPTSHGPPVLERDHMCKANSHAEDSNAKTLPNSCLEAARFAPENCGIHAEKSQYPCSKATIFMPEQHETISKHRENHAQELRNSCRNPTRTLSTPMESRADAASLLRIPNAQRARGVVFDDAKPAQLRATSHHRRLSSRVSAAPNRIAAAGRYRRLPNHNAASRSQITGKRAASPATGRRRCDSGSRSFLCARALPQRSRLRFRVANEFS